MPRDDLLLVRVGRVRQEAADIKLFELEHVDGAPLPAFAAGAHVDVHIRDGLVRQYSLCGDPGDRTAYRIAVKRELDSRGGSKAMHEEVAGGMTLAISHPRNNFPLKEGAGRSLLLAGGIGITPLLSMACQLSRAGSCFSLHYFSRSEAHTAFRDVLSDPRLSASTVLHHLADPELVAARLRDIVATRPEDGHLYVCGPRPFIKLVQDLANPAWPGDSIHYEYFASSDEGAPTAAFTVRLARSGLEYAVPSGTSILAVLQENGVDVAASCEQGICGTCLTRVLGGIPDHRDLFLTDAEKAAGTQIAICVSRAKSDTLVLDL